MNWDRIEGNWKQVRGQIKEKWGKLTDDDLDVIAGQRDQFVGKLQDLYGTAKDRIESDIDEFCRTAYLPSGRIEGAASRKNC